MLDCNIVLARVYADKTARIPSARAARIEHEGTVDQSNRCVDVLLGPAKDESSIDENSGVLIGDRQRRFRHCDSFAAACDRIFCPAVKAKPKVAYASPGEGQPISRVALNGLSKQIKRLQQLLPSQPREISQGVEVEIIGGKIVRRSGRRT